MQEIYLLLFVDTLFCNLVFNVSTALILPTMKIFTQYNTLYVLVITSIAYNITLCINYIMGIICRNILISRTNRSDNKIDQIMHSKYLPIIIACSAIPFIGKFIILFAGLSKVKPKYVLCFAAIVKFIYYIIYINW